MPTTDTNVGRLAQPHPDLGHDPGAGLHGKVRNAWTAFSNHIDSRYFEANIADTATSTFEHSFDVAFSELAVELYEGVHGSGNLTRIDDPAGAGYTIAAGAGDARNQIDVTNGTGGAEDVALVVGVRGKIRNDDVSASAAIAGSKVNPNFGSQNVVTIGSNGVGRTDPQTKSHVTITDSGVSGQSQSNTAITVNNTSGAAGTGVGIKLFNSNSAYTNAGSVEVFAERPGVTNDGNLYIRVADSSAVMQDRIFVSGALGYASFSGGLAMGQQTISDPGPLNNLVTTAGTLYIVGAGGTRDLTGVAAKAPGSVLVLLNGSGSTWTIKHESGSSSVGNRFFSRTTADISLPQSGTAMFVYIADRWRHVANI